MQAENLKLRSSKPWNQLCTQHRGPEVQVLRSRSPEPPGPAERWRWWRAQIAFISWMHDTTVLLMGALLRAWNTWNNNLFAFVASLLHWFQVPAGSAQAEQVVLVNDWQGLSRQRWRVQPRSWWGCVCLCRGWDPLTLPWSRKPQHGVFLLSSIMASLYALCRGPLKQWERPHPNSSTAQKPMGRVCSGERGPLQTAELSSQIRGQTWTRGDRSRFLLFK